MPYILERATGDSPGEKLHALNQAVNVLQSRGIRTPRVMVGYTGTGWRFTEIYLNGKEKAHDYATLGELVSALDTRRASVESVVVALNAQERAA
jgi:hypothetical protein